MALTSDSLSIWEIAFRWAELNPRRIWLQIPLQAQDHFRNLMDAILSAELLCESIELEKRHFEPDEKEFSVYYWIDDIYACIHGHHFNRKLLRHASIARYDFKLWCERRNIPLPEFWFPPGWNLEYELPEDEIHPGHYYIRKGWTREDWEAWQEKQSVQETFTLAADGPSELPLHEWSNSATAECDETQSASGKQEAAAEKFRPSQATAIACRQIAKAIWKDDKNRTIASIIKDELIQKYGGAAPFVDDTVREWIKVVAPPHIRNHRGRPRKNRAEDE